MKIVQYNKIKKIINLKNDYDFLGFTDKLYISKLNYLRTPKCLFKYNLNLYINLNKFIKNYKDINVLGYKSYLITNNIIMNREFIQQIKLNKVNSLISSIIVYNILIIINILRLIILKLLLINKLK